MSSRAFYSPDSFGAAVPLYEGPIVLSGDEHREEYDGVLTFEWLPSPYVRYAGWTREPSHGITRLMEALAPRERTVSIVDADTVPRPPVVVPVPPDDATASSSGPAGRVVVGKNEVPVERVIVHLVNFKAFRTPLVLEAQGWRIAIEPLADLDVLCRELEEWGAFAFTHTADITRTDGTMWTFATSEDVREALFTFLSFCRGAMVGQALPVGLESDGTPVCAEWGVTLVDRWRGLLSWSSRERPDSVVGLFPPFMQKWQDEFWRGVLKRSVRYYIEANGGSVDKALAMAQSTLEMLAWAVLYVDNRWLKTGEGTLHAAAKLRLLLKWAGIPTEIPATLRALQQSARVQTSDAVPSDGPKAFTVIRNEIVHPTRHRLGRPSDELVDAWRLGVWYIELVLLRVLGYAGEYGNRLIPHRWEGDVEPVPWS